VSTLTERELQFADAVRQFNAGDCRGGIGKGLEADLRLQFVAT
jgi:hypothetical protein